MSLLLDTPWSCIYLGDGPNFHVLPQRGIRKEERLPYPEYPVICLYPPACLSWELLIFKMVRDFPSHPVADSPCSPNRGHEFDPSDQISHSVVPDSLWPHELQHARPPCPSPTPGVHWDSRPSSWWCHPAISSSVVPFSSCPQFLPAFWSYFSTDLQ